MLYAFNENFVLPLSHDEVVYGKGSLIGKMPGDDWQKFANLRALYGYMWGHPGKKLLFMGGEFAQRREWTHEGELEWWVTDRPEHAGVRRWIRDLNRGLPHRTLAVPDRLCGRRLRVDRCRTTREMSITTFVRKSAGGAPILVLTNFTPVPHRNFLLGCPQRGVWREILNSDAHEYGGSGLGQSGLRGIRSGERARSPGCPEPQRAAPCDHCYGGKAMVEKGHSGGAQARGRGCRVPGGRRRQISGEAHRGGTGAH